MKKDIPHIEFGPAQRGSFGFEIVPIEKIAQIKNESGHDPRSPHQLKFYNLIFFTHGKGRHYIDFNWYPVQKNTLVYLAKEQVNAFDFSGDLKGYCMVFTEAFFVSCFTNLTRDFVFRLFNPQLYSPTFRIPETSDFKDYFDLLVKEFNVSTSFNHKNIINALFTILISKAEGIKQSQHPIPTDSSRIMLFQRFTTLIENHYSESRNASFYADKLAITYKHLNIVSRETVHKTAKNVIDDFIILQAKRKLINSSIKTTQLAYDLGFEDPTNFTKYFKKQTGLTPKSFIESLSTK